jgi:hypothetical protein
VRDKNDIPNPANVCGMSNNELSKLNQAFANFLRQSHPLTELEHDPCAKCTCIDHADSFAKGRLAGAAEQLKRCEEAVEAIAEVRALISTDKKIICSAKELILKQKAIAAIRTAAIKDSDHDKK